MAKEGGMGAAISVDDSTGTLRAIGNDITNFTMSTPRAVQDVTGIDKSAMERLLLLADFSGSDNGVFNDAVNMSHSVFRTVPSTSVNRTRTMAVSGQTLTAEVLYTDYSLSRGADGSLTFSAPFVLADGTVPVWT